MLSVLAAVSDGDLSTLLVVLAVFAFIGAIYAALRVGVVEAGVLALIGVLILIFA